MTKLPKDKRNRLITVMAGTVVIVAGLWFGVIKTRNAQIVQSRSKVESARNKLEKATARLKQADQLQAEMEAAIKKLKAVEDTMASGADPFSWCYQLLEKARAGHEVNVTKVDPPVKGEVGVLPAFPYDAEIFTIQGIAYYHDFGKFLADFENNFPYFHVRNLSLGSSSDGGVVADASSARTREEKLSFKMDIVALIKPSQ